MTQDRHSTEYFPAVDGLRTLAVLSVFLFHLNGSIPSGFVGVDVFFVISGFVVTRASISLPLTSFGTFITAFYARRLLRILPALLVCLLATIVITTMFVPGSWLSVTNTKTALAAFFGFSNLVLAMTTGDYWSARAEFNPFTHTWSLGVEEQFYLLAPVILFAWLRGYRRAAFIALGVLAAGSLLAAFWFTSPASRVFSFYSLHARFWELAVGVGLAMSLDVWRPVLARLGSGLQSALSRMAVVGLVVSFTLADSAAFPLPWALLPVACTGFLICLTTISATSMVARILKSPASVYVGKRSYSLYLWHWPVFVFARWTTGLETPIQQILAVLASALLCECSYRYVEQRVRFSLPARNWSRLRITVLALVAILVGSAAAGVIAKARPWLNLSASTDATLWSGYTDLPSPSAPCGVATVVKDFEEGSMQTFSPTGCTLNAMSVFVAGDSHAGAYTAMLKKAVRDTGIRVVLFSQSGCSVLGLATSIDKGDVACAKFNSAVLANVIRDASGGDVFFLPSLRVPRISDQTGVLLRRNLSTTDEVEAAVLEAVRLLHPLADRLVRIMFEAPKPVFPSPAFRCADWFNRSNPACVAGFEVERSDVENNRAGILRGMRSISAALPSVSIWDPLPILCPETKCNAYQAGKPLFFDGDHLSGFGNLVLTESFLAAIRPR